MVLIQNLFRKIYFLNYVIFMVIFMMHEFSTKFDCYISSVEIALSVLQGCDSSSVFFFTSNYPYTIGNVHNHTYFQLKLKMSLKLKLSFIVPLKH